MRFFNGKKIELLAPAGNFDIFSGIVDSRCDAIYFGGQRMNMRMIRKGYNFSDQELKEAVDMARDKGKATYITLNNLLDSDEAEEVKEYLHFLSEIKPTSIIVQDAAVLHWAGSMNLNMEIHASVMMNAHNLETLKALESHGVSRVVLSREATLAEAAFLHAHSPLELEYFTHGDMCVAHGAQCYYCSMLFGMSSNRGKCLKPCRWWFDREGEPAYPLAVKDMCMIAHLPEMIQAGITSFKIEGRMREKDFIVQLINSYGEVLDRYIEDPLGYDFRDREKWIQENRKRDLSPGYAFGNPGISNLNTRYEGTGKFYSTGKMFSVPTPENPVNPSQEEYLKSLFPTRNTKKVRLSVRVDDLSQARAALEEGVDRIYLAADVFAPKKPFTLDEIKALNKEKGDTQLFVSTPRMMDEVQFDQYHQWLTRLPDIDGLLISNLGALRAFKNYGLHLVGDFPLNLFNGHAARFYLEEGLEEITPSLELPGEHLRRLLEEDLPMEIISHGRLTSMYMSHDLYAAEGIPPETDLILENEAGKYLVKRDVFGKNHLMMQRHYTLLPVVGCLGNANLRIEGQLETEDSLRRIIRAHLEAILGKADALEQLMEQLPDSGYTFGATRF